MASITVASDKEVATPGTKRPRAEGSDRGPNKFLRAWAWKREHRPDKVRFHKPYVYIMEPGSDGSSGVKLTMKQAPFSAEGFASTVWDSSIVAAKHFEERGRGWAAGKRCLDLSAGCGLPGVVLAQLGAEVTATDLPQNLPLLRDNTEANVGLENVPIRVLEHCWGTDAATLKPPFDVVVACDVMYIDDAVVPLVKTLEAVSGPQTEIYISHGRNRQAEASFVREAEPVFSVEEVPDDELHEVYQTGDVTVLRLKRRKTRQAQPASGPS